MSEQVELGPLGTPMSLPQSQARVSRPNSPDPTSGQAAGTDQDSPIGPSASSTNTNSQDTAESNHDSWRFPVFALLNKRAAIGITTLTLALTCFSLWPNFTAQHDTRSALTLAEWTAQKDFLEWCSAQVR